MPEQNMTPNASSDPTNPTWGGDQDDLQRYTQPGESGIDETTGMEDPNQELGYPSSRNPQPGAPLDDPATDPYAQSGHFAADESQTGHAGIDAATRPNDLRDDDMEDDVTNASRDSFPASDPPARNSGRP